MSDWRQRKSGVRDGEGKGVEKGKRREVGGNGERKCVRKREGRGDRGWVWKGRESVR